MPAEQSHGDGLSSHSGWISTMQLGPDRPKGPKQFSPVPRSAALGLGPDVECYDGRSGKWVPIHRTGPCGIERISNEHWPMGPEQFSPGQAQRRPGLPIQTDKVALKGQNSGVRDAAIHNQKLAPPGV